MHVLGDALAKAGLKAANFAKAQETVYSRAKDNGLAALGKWSKAA